MHTDADILALPLRDRDTCMADPGHFDYALNGCPGYETNLPGLCGPG